MTADDPLLGRVLEGKYRLEATLGRGGMGAVYTARHLALGHACAIKVLRPERAGDASAARRFVREAKQTFLFEDPHCVRVFDFGLGEDDLLYLVMELLEGRTLGSELRLDGPLSSARAAHVGAHIAQALACAHRLGFVHRDLKPENIMLLHHRGDPDYVKVLDFGLAKIFDAGAADLGVSLASLTQDGIVFGTPEYMSPEQAMGRSLDPRSDLYSLGVVLFEAITGRLPFTAPAPMALLVKHVKERPPRASSIAGERVAADLDDLIEQCLAKAPADRPTNAEELAERLAAIEARLALGPRPASHPRAAPEAPLASSLAETAALSAHAVPRPVSARVPPPTAQGTTAATAITSAAHGLETQAVVHAALGRRRWPALAVGAVLAAGAAALWLGVAGGQARAPATAAAPAAAPAVQSSPTTGAVATAATAPAPASAASPSIGPGHANDPGAAPVDASPPSIKRQVAAATRPAAPEPEAEPRSDPKLEALLARAERARRNGELLSQMAAADEALRRAPNHPRAAFLVGEALVKQSDPGAGCGYLRRARSLKEARALLRSACPSD